MLGSLLRDAFEAIPMWIALPLMFLYFLAISLGCRTLVVKRCEEDRRKELSDHAGALITGVAASFAFFVGFAITMSWGAVSAGQAAVESQAARAQQVLWVLNNISDETAATKMTDELHTYLVTAAEKDGPYLATGNTMNPPSGVHLDTLQSSIHAYAFGPDSADPEVTPLVSAAADLNASAASVTAVAQRSLPPIMVLLLFISASILSAITGISTAVTRRPVFLPVWCLIPALAIAVIPGPGGIGIDLTPLMVVAERITG